MAKIKTSFIEENELVQDLLIASELEALTDNISWKPYMIDAIKSCKVN